MDSLMAFLYSLQGVGAYALLLDCWWAAVSGCR